MMSGGHGASAGPLYWVLILIAGIGCALIRPYGWVAGIFFTPLVQLAVSFVAFCILAASPNRQDYFWSIGRITLGTILGTIAGVALMFFLLLLLKR
jgi:hypothetical protein